MIKLIVGIFLTIILGLNNKKINKEPQGCNCHCRIGHYKGQSVKEYPNPVINVGVVESWGGIFGATDAKASLCKKRCTDAAFNPLNHMSKAEFCAKAERFLSGQNRIPMQRLAVYWKVGGRKWQCVDTRIEKCE
ncbi:MAG: hypothetical protein WAT37_13070 [Saprospiraceae bacterium]